MSKGTVIPTFCDWKRFHTGAEGGKEGGTGPELEQREGEGLLGKGKTK